MRSRDSARAGTCARKSTLVHTAAAVVAMFLADTISRRGAGNGPSLIILAGLVAAFLPALADAYRLLAAGSPNRLAVFVLATPIVMALAIAIRSRALQTRAAARYSGG